MRVVAPQKSLIKFLTQSLFRSLYKTHTKFVHVLTACVYVFTTVGPSISQATQTITVTEVVEERPLVVNLRPDSREDYKRYDLSITPEKGEVRHGVHFRFQNYESPENSLETFVNFQGPFPIPILPPLSKKTSKQGLRRPSPGLAKSSVIGKEISTLWALQKKHQLCLLRWL